MNDVTVRVTAICGLLIAMPLLAFLAARLIRAWSRRKTRALTGVASDSSLYPEQTALLPVTEIAAPPLPTLLDGQEADTDSVFGSTLLPTKAPTAHAADTAQLREDHSDHA